MKCPVKKQTADHGNSCLDKGPQGVKPLWLLFMALAGISAPLQDCFLKSCYTYELILSPAEPSAECSGL